MKVQIKLNMLIRGGTQFYIYPFRDYLPRLNAKLQDGTELPILPYTELSRLLNREITLDEIRKITKELATGVIEEEITNSNNFAVILLPERKDDFYDELELNWKEPIRRQLSGDILTYNVPINKQYPPTRQSSLYIEIKVSDKYELVKMPVPIALDDAQPEIIGIENPRKVYPPRQLVESTDYEIILEDKRDYVLRFARDFPQTIRIDYKIGVPLMVRNWAWFGLIAGIALIPFNPYIFSLVPGSFKFSIALTAGIVASMTGLRIILFHDVELMAKWNWAYIILISANLMLLAVLALKCVAACF